MDSDKVLVLDVGMFSAMEIEGKVRRDDIRSKNKHKKKRIKSYCMNNKPKGPMGWKNKLILNLLNKYMELYF